MTTEQPLLWQRIRDMGALRNSLHLTALVFTALLPFARAVDYSDGWNLFFAGILPATAPLIVIVIGLDIMMSAIWRSDAEGNAAEISRLTFIIRTHQLVGGILLLTWLAVFLPMLI